MNYRLVVTTDGRPGYLERMLDSFEKRVRPTPAEIVVVDDSGDEHYVRYLMQLAGERRWRLIWHPQRQGFCRTVADGWREAGEPGPDWVFWTEDDFEFTRSIELGDLGHVLDHEAPVAQMALYRNPVSSEEHDAGGYIPMRRGAYAPRGSGNVRWFEHTVCWTTNPSLFRASFARAYPWIDDGKPACEGRFGFDLREKRPETTYGIWGAGEPWVEHFGERAGRGY